MPTMASTAPVGSRGALQDLPLAALALLRGTKHVAAPTGASRVSWHRPRAGHGRAVLGGAAGPGACGGTRAAATARASPAGRPRGPASLLHGAILRIQDCLNPCAFILFSLEGGNLCGICPLLNLPQQQPESLLCLGASLPSTRRLVTLNSTGSFDVSV